MKGKTLFPLVTLLCLANCPGLAAEPDLSLHGKVTGNQEQPRVMYILPWQQAGHVHFEQDFNAPLADDLFAPLDPEEFVRDLNYRAVPAAAQDGGEDENTELLSNTH